MIDFAVERAADSLPPDLVDSRQIPFMSRPAMPVGPIWAGRLDAVAGAAERLKQLWHQLSARQHPSTDQFVDIGRRLAASHLACWVGFEELCSKPLADSIIDRPLGALRLDG